MFVVYHVEAPFSGVVAIYPFANYWRRIRFGWGNDRLGVIHVMKFYTYLSVGTEVGKSGHSSGGGS